jgi:hypothetical protein
MLLFGDRFDARDHGLGRRIETLEQPIDGVAAAVLDLEPQPVRLGQELRILKVRSKASRNACTRSAGTPGGAKNGPPMLQRFQSSGKLKPSAAFFIILSLKVLRSFCRASRSKGTERPGGKIVVVQIRGGRVASPQQNHKPSTT